jgi:hypothetical protein
MVLHTHRLAVETAGSLHKARLRGLIQVAGYLGVAFACVARALTCQAPPQL